MPRLLRWGLAHECPGLSERPDAVDTEFAAKTGLTDSAEWQARVLGRYAVAVDADGAGDELSGDAVGQCVVARPDRRGQAEVGGIGRGDGSSMVS